MFEIAHGTNSITTLASFDYDNGSNPSAGVVLDSGGNLYGTTQGGGSSGNGTVFEIAAGSHTITTLASFDYDNGAYPTGGVVQDSGGNLYGTTQYGGSSGSGTVFEIAVGSNTITTLASLDYTNSGEYPSGGVVLDSAGNLYGTASYGGSSYYGTVFEVAAGSNIITALASFNYDNGASPFGSVVLDSAGNLYGTTQGGGSSGNGTVFEIAAGSNTITTLASFTGDNGANPYAGVVLDGSGNLYGTSSYGGSKGDGTVFEITAGSNTITTLANFNYDIGVQPYAGVVRDGGGNLYGTTTYGGGGYGDGTVFEIAAGSNTITTLASFTGSNGAYPLGDLVLDSAGNLYGTTQGGGSSGYGTVWEIAHGTNTITTLANFTGDNGSYPDGGLVLDSAGNLYGTTQYGGSSDAGTLFEIAHGSNIITTLASFDYTNNGAVSVRRPRSGQRRQSLRRRLPRREQWRRHGVRAGCGLEHHHRTGQL